MDFNCQFFVFFMYIKGEHLLKRCLDNSKQKLMNKFLAKKIETTF
jgi:hypothetical protein